MNTPDTQKIQNLLADGRRMCESDFGRLVLTKIRLMRDTLSTKLDSEPITPENMHSHNVLKGQKAAFDFLLEPLFGVEEELEQNLQLLRSEIAAFEIAKEKYPDNIKTFEDFKRTTIPAQVSLP